MPRVTAMQIGVVLALVGAGCPSAPPPRVAPGVVQQAPAEAAVVPPPGLDPTAAADPRLGSLKLMEDGGLHVHPSSPFGGVLSTRWALGHGWERVVLAPVANPHPSPEPQPRREHPFDLALSQDGAKLYVTLLGSELQPGTELVVLDVASASVVGRVPLRHPGAGGPSAASAYRLLLHPTGRWLFVTARFANFLTVIDTQTDTVAAEVPLDFYGQGMAVSADGGTLWVADRYLDQVLVVDVTADADAFYASLRVQGGLDPAAFLGASGEPGLEDRLGRRCGTGGCHGGSDHGFVVGPDPAGTLASALEYARPGELGGSSLWGEVVPSAAGGWADRVPTWRGHGGGVIFPTPKDDPDAVALREWIDGARPGPGIPIGNPGSKPKVMVLSPDGRHLFVGNTGTQAISIVDTATGQEIGDIYTQNVVNDLGIAVDPGSGRQILLATSLGVGFGVQSERDPWGGETWDPKNPAAQWSVRRDLNSGETLPKSQQNVLGPYDAVDGTAAIKFRDAQNDLIAIDLGRLVLPAAPSPRGEPLPHLLQVNRYEAHEGWVRYTSDTAESTRGDMKGDIPPELMRVVGALPEKLAIRGDRVFVTMSGSNSVQEWRLRWDAPDPSDLLEPVASHPAGLIPTGIAAGRDGTVAAGLVFTADLLGGTVTIVDPAARTQRQVVIDASILDLPVPATNAERGELFAHSALFSSDADTACVSCHYLDLGDGRPWGVSQVVGQEFLPGDGEVGHLVIGGTMGVPQMRALYEIQPFFLEGTLSVYEPRSMLMEHAPADDFAGPTPQGDWSHIMSARTIRGANDVQSRMAAASDFDATLEERRDEMFRVRSMGLMGKAFTLRDFQRFVGEWQASEPRLLPNPFDGAARPVRRGRQIFEKPQVGCVSCHPPPAFARKDLPDNETQSFPPQVTTSVRDLSFTLISMNRLDSLNGETRDIEAWDPGRAETKQGHFAALQLRGIWDRPPVFLHNGMARSLREVLAPPDHPALRRLRYVPLLGGVPERPGAQEVGFNETWIYTQDTPSTAGHRESGARVGTDTHGGTTHLSARQLDDLVSFLESIQ